MTSKRLFVATPALLAALALPLTAAAQSTTNAPDTDTLPPTLATMPLEAQLSGAPGPSPWAQRIAEADLRRLDVEQTQAWTLFSWGALNVVEGAAIAIPGLLSPQTSDARTTSYGAMTAAWGAVNLALGIPWIVRLGRERPQNQRWGRLSADELERESERARDTARFGASFFAVNTGLDVAYITAGALMLSMGERAESRNVIVSGMGIAVLVQGLALLGFDAWGWASRHADGSRLRDARRPREADRAP